MSSALPKQFDPQRLAGEDIRLEGELNTSGMSRLQESLASNEPSVVNVKLHLWRDKGGRAVIDGSFASTLSCVCQRCMEPVAVEVQGDFSLGVISSEDEMASLPDDLEPLMLEHGQMVDPETLIEDELILALPVISRHADTADCGPRAAVLGKREPQEIAAEGQAEKPNPFAILKDLKTGKSD